MNCNQSLTNYNKSLIGKLYASTPRYGVEATSMNRLLFSVKRLHFKFKDMKEHYNVYLHK